MGIAYHVVVDAPAGAGAAQRVTSSAAAVGALFAAMPAAGGHAVAVVPLEQMTAENASRCRSAGSTSAAAFDRALVVAALERETAPDTVSALRSWLLALDAAGPAARLLFWSSDASLEPETEQETGAAGDASAERRQAEAASRDSLSELQALFAQMRSEIGRAEQQLAGLGAPRELLEAAQEAYGHLRVVFARGMDARIRALESDPADPEDSATQLTERLSRMAVRLARLEQRTSGVATPEAAPLAALVRESAARLLEAGNRALGILDRVRAARPTPVPVPDGTSRQLDCSVCGRTAVVFEMGTSRTLGKGFVYRGIARELLLDERTASRIIAWLDAGEIERVHQSIPEGIDGWCPECGSIYCRQHYRVEEVYDDDFRGWYDASYATCPAGHRRMIDD